MIIIGIVIGFAIGAAAAVVARKNPPPPVQNVMKNKIKRGKKTQDPEQKRLQQLLENIDNYDGTGRGQVKIG